MTSDTQDLLSPTRSVDQFRDWLRHEIAKSTDLAFGEVNFARSIHSLGMSSVHVVRLAGDIEDLLGIEVEPTSFYEFETIDQLCDELLATRERRQQRAEQSAPALAPLVVAATFTAEPLGDTLRHLLTQLGLPLDLTFARYNQVFQELLNPQGLVGSATQGMAAIVVRLEDLFRFSPEAPGLAAAETMVGDLLDALAHAGGRSRIPLLLTLAPHSPKAVRRLGLAEALAALDQRLIEGARVLPNVQVLDLRHVDKDYTLPRVWDEVRDELGHIPFTPACYAALSAGIARRCAALVFGPAKVIVLDCDNTLWGGVCGEDGPQGVRTDGPWHALQAFMVGQQQSGKLLCLCSKNNLADVQATFAAHPGMPLQWDMVTAHRVNWQRKSENIRALAKELDLGLDSFIFLDDSPMECEEVRSALPQVLTLQLPTEPHRIEAYIGHHWAFDSLQVTEEDRRRTEMYRQRQAREVLRGESSSLEDFLERLVLEIDIAEVAPEERPRAAQLTQRTNQFNACKRVMTEGDLGDWLATPGQSLWRVRVRDRFGDYGMVGLMAGRVFEDTLHAEAFMLSCRVLGRGVEHAMVRHLSREALERGCRQVHLPFVDTGRNQVARDFYASLGQGLAAAPGGSKAVRFEADAVDGLLSGAVHQQRATDEQAGPQAAAPVGRAQAANGLEAIAQMGRQIERLELQARASGSTKRPPLPTEYATPRTAWEQRLCAIWRDVLRIDQVGIHDDFHALGGDSLRAAEAFARMWDMGVPESVSLQTVEAPTVAHLARAIEAAKSGGRPTLLSDTFRLADEGLLAPDIRIPGSDPATYDAPMRRVLLTGATGYVGAFLLHELMKQTETQVLCLVRAATPEDGIDRVLSNLRKYQLETQDTRARLSVVLGDLTEPGLGLAPDRLAALARDIDSIVHSAAWVNFVYPYQHLKASNVDATETLLRLACADAPRRIQFHYVSTMGVIMSTGYDRSTPIPETSPLLHADDLLNGYEQSKYASDKMVWTAFKERGIPGAIYRPPLVSGLADGTYHKLDEFLPQVLKGCLQLQCFPAIDSPWEMVPIDFVSKSIVHIARQPRHLNKAYFITHPDSCSVSDYIAWYQRAGFTLRSVPWEVWKKEFLGLGSEMMRKNALFPFVDFIRALSQDQIYFPPVETRQFRQAIADLACDPPPALDLLDRYTRHFIASGFYDEVPGVPAALKAPPREPAARGAGAASATRAVAGTQPDVSASGQPWLDERLRFRPGHVNETEAYYVLWNDPVRGLSMVVRYVLFHGPIQEAQVAEVWCWFLDRQQPGRDVAVRQRYSIGRAELINGEDVRLRIGPSGYGAQRVWGEVKHGSDRVEWDWTVDTTQALPLERVSGLEGYGLFPHFQSNGAVHRVNGTVTVNGHRYPLLNQLASDGHYWDTHHLEAWSWGHCARFDGDDDLLFEGISARLNDWTQPSAWLTFRYKGTLYTSNIVDSFYFNRENEATLDSWRFTAERGDLRFVGTMTAHNEEQTLIVHPRTDGSYLYTHITYTGDMQLDIEQRQGDQWWKLETRVATGTAAFEVTRPTRNPAVTREFRIMRAR